MDGHFAVGHQGGVDHVVGVVQPGDGVGARGLAEGGGVGGVPGGRHGLGGPAGEGIGIFLGGLPGQGLVEGHLAGLGRGGVDHVLAVQPVDGERLRGLLRLNGLLRFNRLLRLNGLLRRGGVLRDLVEHRGIGRVAGHRRQRGLPALEYIGIAFGIGQGRVGMGGRLTVGHAGLVDDVALVVQPGDGIHPRRLLEGGGVGGVAFGLDHLGGPAGEGVGILLRGGLGRVVMLGQLARLDLGGVDQVAGVVQPGDGIFSVDLFALFEGGGIGGVLGDLGQRRLPAREGIGILFGRLDRVVVGGQLAISDFGLVYLVALVVQPGDGVGARLLFKGGGVGGVLLGLDRLGVPAGEGIGGLLGGLLFRVLVGGHLAVLDLGEVDQLALVIQPGDGEGALGLLELGLVGHVLGGLGHLGLPTLEGIGILPVVVIGGILGLLGLFALLHLVLFDSFAVHLPLDGVVGVLLALCVGRREGHARHQQRHAEHDGQPRKAPTILPVHVYLL